MRILDADAEHALEGTIVLYLTREEAVELAAYLNTLLTTDPQGHHHVNSHDSCEEVIVCLYDRSGPLDHFDEVSRKLILRRQQRD